MKINVGSENPAKIGAVREAFQNYFNKVKVKSVKVNGIRPPTSLLQIIEGAQFRAIESFTGDCDYSVGLESGIFRLPITNTEYCNVCACVIYNGKEIGGIGFSPGFEYPGKVVDKIFKENKEAGEIFDKIVNQQNTKHNQGAVGILSKNIISRKDYTKYSVIMALLPILNKELYKK